MKKTVIQILESLFILVLLLMVPLVVESISQRNKPEIHKAISVQAANTTKEPGIRILHNSESNTKSIAIQSNIQKIGLYTLLVLFIISVISFLKYKIAKDLHEQQ